MNGLEHRLRRIVVCAGALFLLACGDPALINLKAKLNAPDRNSLDWVRLNSCFDQMHRAVYTWRSYRNLLAELTKDRYVVVPLREFAAAATTHPDKVVVGMRHDMDGNFCKAITMAETEYAQGIRATYFVRHTEKYYSYDWPHPQRIRAILPDLLRVQRMGHEVGLHLDSVTMAWLYGFNPAELLSDELAYLRGAGLDIRGTSAHGSDEARDYHFSNFEVFEGMTTRTTLVHGPRRIPLGEHAMNEFDLDYEAYHMKNKYYFSDAGGRWNESPLHVLPDLKPGENAIILSHPEWWGADDEQREYY